VVESGADAATAAAKEVVSVFGFFFWRLEEGCSMREMKSSVREFLIWWMKVLSCSCERMRVSLDMCVCWFVFWCGCGSVTYISEIRLELGESLFGDVFVSLGFCTDEVCIECTVVGK